MQVAPQAAALLLAGRRRCSSRDRCRSSAEPGGMRGHRERRGEQLQRGAVGASQRGAAPARTPITSTADGRAPVEQGDGLDDRRGGAVTPPIRRRRPAPPTYGRRRASATARKHVALIPAGQLLADPGHHPDRIDPVPVKGAVHQPLQPDPNRVEPDRDQQGDHRRGAAAGIGAAPGPHGNQPEVHTQDTRPTTAGRARFSRAPAGYPAAGSAARRSSSRSAPAQSTAGSAPARPSTSGPQTACTTMAMVSDEHQPQQLPTELLVAAADSGPPGQPMTPDRWHPRSSPRAATAAAAGRGSATRSRGSMTEPARRGDLSDRRDGATDGADPHQPSPAWARHPARWGTTAARAEGTT